jgi:hypothetical protein
LIYKFINIFAAGSLLILYSFLNRFLKILVMIRFIPAAYICPVKNAFRPLAAFLVLVFACANSAQAQFSLMFGPTYQQYTSAPKGYPFVIGINPRLAFDIGQRSQVSIQSSLEYPARWEYRNNIRLTGVVLSTNVPVPAGKDFGLGMVEFSALYSYFLKGKNFTRGGLYVSGGPGAVIYVNKTSQFTSTEKFLGGHTDFVFDARIGGQYDISIGWMYLEGRIAPTLFSQGLEADQVKPGALYGVNLGVRFLLNRHPYCAD